MDLIFCISGLQIFIVLAQKLLLGRRGENPEVGPELLGSVLPWEHVADLPWDPGSRFSSSSVPFRNFFFFSIQARLTLRVSRYPGNIFWRRGNAFTLKTQPTTTTTRSSRFSYKLEGGNPTASSEK